MAAQEDVAGQCNAHCYISDDWGDNRATMRCQLEPGHAGHHKEVFHHDESEIVVTWEINEREPS